HEVKVHVLLTKGEMFEAGRGVARLKKYAAETGHPMVGVIANAADLALLTAVGDLSRASEAFGATPQGARAAQAPVRDAWARLVWVDTLRRVGDSQGTRSHLARLTRVETIAPALLRREIRRRLSTDGSSPNVRCRTTPNQPHSALSIALLRMAQEDDD